MAHSPFSPSFALRKVQIYTSPTKSFEAHLVSALLLGIADVNTFSRKPRSHTKIGKTGLISRRPVGEDRHLTSKTPSPLSKLDAGLTADISAVSQIDVVASKCRAARPEWDSRR